jgi:hypothetical protein
MPRLAKVDVHAALERAAKNIITASPNDPFISRRDMRAQLRKLHGIERSLTDIFYRFVDHRDAAPGARITAKDVREALAYAKAKLIDQYDLDENGFSADEVARMSRTGKLAVALAYELKRSASAAATGWLDELDELRAGLYYHPYASEREAPLYPVRLAAQLDRLTRKTFAGALRLDPANPKQVITIFEPTPRLLDPARAFLPASDRGVARARRINQVAAEHVRSTHQIVLGVDDPAVLVEHPVYLVGLTVTGEIVGYRTVTVWT